jgi:hypothetical protein
MPDAWGGSFGGSWGPSWGAEVASVESTAPRGGIYRLYKKKKKRKDIPPDLVARLLDPPPPQFTPEEMQAFAAMQAQEAAQREALQAELQRIQEQHARLLKEDEELLWLLMTS